MRESSGVATPGGREGTIITRLTSAPGLVVVLLATVACSGGAYRARSSPLAASRSAEASIEASPGRPVVGDIEPVPDYPKSVPAVVQPFPPQLRYAGQVDVAGKHDYTMSVVRFGEGHPAFQPTILLGSPGQRLRLMIANRTPTLHNFSTVEGRIDRDIPAGKGITEQVTFPHSGGLVFYCKYHAIQDLHIGELKVTGAG
jgi:plastocyanin